ncbi:hypothetical protein NQ315_010992, partial [Exocentrus adspersus]
RRKRTVKTRPINKRRNTHGFFKAYFLPMKEGDAEQFFKYTRMSVPTFNKLLKLVTPYLLERKLPDTIRFLDSEERQGSWRDDVDPLPSVGRLAANRAQQVIYNIRDSLKSYFLSPAGKIPWQENVLREGRDVQFNYN